MLSLLPVVQEEVYEASHTTFDDNSNIYLNEEEKEIYPTTFKEQDDYYLADRIAKAAACVPKPPSKP